MTANGTTHTTEEAIVSVCDLDMFVPVQLLKETPAVLSLGNLREANGRQSGGVLKGGPLPSGGGPARVPNLRRVSL